MELKNKLLCALLILQVFFNPGSGIVLASDADDDCEAFFYYQQVAGDPLSIQFLDASNVSSFVNYYWEFGDNTSSSEQDPVHTYQQPGVYEVCLYISDATKMCYDKYCKTILVPVPTNCEASFTYELDGSNPLLVNFESTTGSDIDSLWWDLGDGSTSVEANPSHLYADTGTFIVTLNAKNTVASEICWSQHTDTVVCSIEECISKFEIQPHPINPFIYNFNAVGQGNINSYRWSFGDGRYSDLPNPIHTYSDTGTFTIKLVVSNFFFPEYCSDSSEQSIHIKLAPCQSLFSYVQDSLNPLLFTFLNSSSGPGDIWHWTFGDGSASSEINPVHNYSDTGDFDVCLTITNTLYPDYCNDVTCQPVHISDLQCSAGFTYTRDTSNILSVTFISADNLGPANIYKWNFGDNEASLEMNPVHQYPDTGWYVVGHQVINDNFPQFCYDTHDDSIYIGFLKFPEADFTYSFDSLSLTPNLFHFTDLSHGTYINKWKWAFGDGTYSPLQNPSHHFGGSSGYYNICLEVTDTIPPKYNLKSQQCKTIQTRRYFNLGGSVYDGAIPINNPNPEGDTAEVTLYRHYNDEIIIPVNSGYFSNLGYYYFQDVLEGEYVLKGRITDESRQAGKYFPTWSEEALNWNEAALIELDHSLFAQNIYLQPMPTLPNGLCGIDGIVIEVDGPSATTGISMPGVTVFLADMEGNKLRYNVSDVTGRFLFRNLPTGDYKLFADYPGYKSTTETASLTTAFPFGGNVRVRIYNESSIGTDEPADPADDIMVNNPFSDMLTVFLPSGFTGSSRLTVRNALGQPVITNTTEKDNIVLNTEMLPDGLYYLQIENQSTRTRIKKLIKL